MAKTEDRGLVVVKTIHIPNLPLNGKRGKRDTCVNKDHDFQVVFDDTGNLGWTPSGTAPDFPEGRFAKDYTCAKHSPKTSGGHLDWTFINDSGKIFHGSVTIRSNDATCDKNDG